MATLTTQPAVENAEAAQINAEQETVEQDSTSGVSVTEQCARVGEMNCRRPEELPVVNEAKAIPPVHSAKVLSALLWLQGVLFFKEKKRNIFMLVLSVVVVALVFTVKFFTVSLYVRCPDG